MKNWTVKEAINEIVNGTNAAAIAELGKHYPMFVLAVAKGDLVAVANMMPEKFTLRRLTTGDADTGNSDADGNDAAEVEPDGEEAGADTSAGLESMSTKELITLCAKRGIKVPKYGKNKQFYIDALNGAGDNDDAVEDAEAEDDTNLYAGKTAMELYKECRKRGIKCQAKKDTKYYAELLANDDAKADPETESKSNDDGWDDEAEDEPVKKPAKAAKPAAKSAKPKKEDEGDDDDWDI